MLKNCPPFPNRFLIFDGAAIHKIWLKSILHAPDTTKVIKIVVISICFSKTINNWKSIDKFTATALHWQFEPNVWIRRLPTIEEKIGPT